MEVRKCRSCGTEYPVILEHFAPDRRKRNGLTSSCRPCVRKRSNEWRKNNPDKIWARKYPQLRKLVIQKWRGDNLIKIREKQKEARREYYKNNREKILMAQRKAHPDLYLRHKEKIAYKNKIRYASLRREMLTAYGNECTCCGESHSKFLTLEHIDRTGKEHRKGTGQSSAIYTDLKRKGWPKRGYTILCWNCNLAQSRGDTCPHTQRLNSIEESFIFSPVYN